MLYTALLFFHVPWRFKVLNLLDVVIHLSIIALLTTCKLLVLFLWPPGSAGISDFRVRSGLDLVVFGWSRAPWGRFGPIFGAPGTARTDIRPDSTLNRRNFVLLPR